LATRFGGQPVSVGEVFDSLGARGSALLAVVCALPCATPITIAGLSVPFGLAILLLTARLALGLPPWLPRRLRAVVLPPKFFVRLAEGGSRLLGWIERRLRPRWPGLTDARWKLRVHMAAAAFSGLLLLLPLPPFPPFTNTLPALGVIVLTMSLLERDGVGLVAGYGVVAFTVGYFWFWAAVLVEAMEKVAARLGW
jgi:hypothetical protein